MGYDGNALNKKLDVRAEPDGVLVVVARFSWTFAFTRRFFLVIVVCLYFLCQEKFPYPAHV
jgi:hypothetical protein